MSIQISFSDQQAICTENKAKNNNQCLRNLRENLENKHKNKQKVYLSQIIDFLVTIQQSAFWQKQTVENNEPVIDVIPKAWFGTNITSNNIGHQLHCFCVSNLNDKEMNAVIDVVGYKLSSNNSMSSVFSIL
jgi:hypothetical protein